MNCQSVQQSCNERDVIMPGGHCKRPLSGFNVEKRKNYFLMISVGRVIINTAYKSMYVRKLIPLLIPFMIIMYRPAYTLIIA